MQFNILLGIADVYVVIDSKSEGQEKDRGLHIFCNKFQQIIHVVFVVSNSAAVGKFLQQLDALKNRMQDLPKIRTKVMQ